jgi:16S rRNA (guanine527-N7)-methyltransferase
VLDYGSSFSEYAFRDFFPQITEQQIQQLNMLPALYKEWNARINVISRKDESQIMLHHIWHSLALALRFQPAAGSKILDVGTGGGFPGIPLAIIYPHCQFILCDSIGKKITVVNHIAEALSLSNVQGVKSRCEELNMEFQYVVSRAVAPAKNIIGWTKKLIPSKEGNAWWFLKGGELNEEFNGIILKEKTEIFTLIRQDFFKQKFIIQVERKTLH